MFSSPPIPKILMSAVASVRSSSHAPEGDLICFHSLIPLSDDLLSSVIYIYIKIVVFEHSFLSCIPTVLPIFRCGTRKIFLETMPNGSTARFSKPLILSHLVCVNPIYGCGSWCDYLFYLHLPPLHLYMLTHAYIRHTHCSFSHCQRSI